MECASVPDPTQVRERDREFVWHPWSPLSADRAEIMIARAKNHQVWDVSGNEYIDASSLSSTCGYAHPDVIEAISSQLSRLHGVDMSIASHEAPGLLAERLASYLPATLNKTLFVNSGSEGCDAAAMIANWYWSNRGQRRSRMVAFAEGYHGSTLLSRTLSRLPRVGHQLQLPLTVTYVDLSAPPAEIRRPELLSRLLAAFDQAIGGNPADLPSAVIVEPFLNVGGGIVLPKGFLAELRRLCDERGTLLILDEVFTAYGRTGRMFAFQHEDAVPDVLVTSKGLSGGYCPIATVTVADHVYESFAHEPMIGGLRYGHTTSGHAGACAGALAVLDVVDKEKLCERAELLGARLADRLAPLAGQGELIDVRGFGLIVVLEFSSVEAATLLKERARAEGLLLRQPGTAVMVVPPMTIDETVIDDVAERLERVLSKAVL